MKIIILICIIIVLLILFLYTGNKVCNNILEPNIYDTSILGPTVLIIGTTHGNEPGGYYTIKYLMEKNILVKPHKMALIYYYQLLTFQLLTKIMGMTLIILLV